MARGRKTGQINLTLDEIQAIVKMTLSGKYNRTEIAKAINKSKNTVLRYQKYFGLI